MILGTFLAMAPAPQQGGQGGAAGLLSLLPMVLILLIFYFLLIRPQQQRQKKHQAMISELKKGDRVLTAGGLFATVLNVKDDRIVATIGEDVKVEIAKQFVTGLVEKG
jgi:preprotein translocase subunit YajC